MCIRVRVHQTSLFVRYIILFSFCFVYNPNRLPATDFQYWKTCPISTPRERRAESSNRVMQMQTRIHTGHGVPTVRVAGN